MEDLKVQSISGGSIVEFPPLFSPDGELLFTIYNKLIRVFSATTGERMRDFGGFKDNIIGVHIDLFNPKLLVACSITGEVITYKWKSGVISNEIKVSIPTKNYRISNFYLIDTGENRSNGLITWTEQMGKNCQMNYFDLSQKTPNLIQIFKENPLKNTPIKISVSKKYNYFSFIQEKYLFLVDIQTSSFRSFLHYKKLTTVECHPIDMLVVTGVDDGNIIFWSNFSNTTPVKSVNHWHQGAVNTTVFSASGSSCYSGGMERVLVKWISNNEELDFLPRLPATILHAVVSLNSTSIAISLENNEIQLYNSNKKKTVAIQSFGRISDDNTGRSLFPIGLKRNPRTNSLVLNGREGHLQFFSTHSKSLLYTMDAIGENYLSESKKIIFNSQVVKAAFTMDWMVTAECRDCQQSDAITRLRFWYFDQEKQNYSLNTVVESPHEHKITALEFSSSYSVTDLLCVSVGGDNYIKIWSIGNDQKFAVWNFLTKFNYKNFPINSISFSQDGSLLAAGTGNTLCVWSLDKMKLKCALSAPAGMDGSINKILISMSKNVKQIKKNSGQKLNIQNDILTRKKKILEQIKLFLESNNNEIIKNIRLENSKIGNTINVHESIKPNKLNSKEKELIFKKIMPIQDMNINQKMELFHYLKINYNIPIKSKLININKENYLKSAEHLTEMIRNLNCSEKYLMQKKLFNFNLRKNGLSFKVNKYDTKISNKSFSKTLDYVKASELKRQIKNKNRKEIKENGVKKDDIIGNGFFKISEKLNNNLLNPIKVISQINHVVFGRGEFIHLVVVCTENRLLVWNLLTLRLQTVLKLSVKEIVVDQITGLMAAFSIYNDLYIFLPNVPMPIYLHKDLPKIYGAAWMPRRVPKNVSINIDWQSTSQLFFISDKQELLYLVSDHDEEHNISSITLQFDRPMPLPYTPFGAVLAKQIEESNKSMGFTMNGYSEIGVPGTSVVQKLIGLTSHTMIPVNQLCTDFIKSLLIVENSKSVENQFTSDDNEILENNIEVQSDDDETNNIKERKVKESVLENYKHNSGKQTDLVNLTLENQLKQFSKEQITFVL